MKCSSVIRSTVISVTLVLWNGCDGDSGPAPTHQNSPPTVPSNPQPANNAVDQPTSLTLRWDLSTDPDNDPITYDLYFGTSTVSSIIDTNIVSTTYSPGTLSLNTTYYWKVIAKDNHGGSTPGHIWNFTTFGGAPPTVVTAPITGITSDAGEGGGNVVSPGGSPITARGLCWSSLHTPTTADSHTVDGSGGGSFASSMTGLSPSTTYYVRAYATNSAGTSYGNERSFSTFAGADGPPCPGVPPVTYASKTYNTVQIGTQCWLRENLDVGTMVFGSQNQTNNGTIEKYCYGNDPAKCDTFGGLYQWNEAMQYNTAGGGQGICPPGWHVPTLEEFQTLSATVNGDGNALKAIGQGSLGGVGTNISGFSVLLAGERLDDGSFLQVGYSGLFWSSTQFDATFAQRLYLNNANPNINLYYPRKNYGFSIRCIKD